MLVENFNNIFKNECNYKRINEICNIKMRNNKKGIKLTNSIYYRFLYAKKDMTKDRIVSLINYKNGTEFTRQSYNSKENNIPIQIYINIFHKIQSFYNCNYNEEKNFNLIAIDGTYNNDNDRKEMLNMGFYNISNGIPIDVKLYGKENKNKEISCAINYIMNNMNHFKNNIIVCDRGYHSYDFFNFLIKNNLKFIIRIKGNGDNLDSSNIFKTKIANYDKINEIKNKVRIIRYEKIIEKTIYSSNSKKKIETHSLKIKNDCVIVTNLLDENIFSKEIILDYYRSRWDIEVFFKYIKYNYKFQHLNVKSSMEYAKMYVCELILTYMAKLIEKYYLKEFKITKKIKINKSNLINGIFDVLLNDILNSELTEDKLNEFCKTYIKIIYNKENRSFPRTSKTPFTKWYVKGYSNQTKYMSIIEAIKGNDLSNLNKNLKTIAKRIISIDNINYNFNVN
jgi:Transposase DDE domain